MAMKKLLSVNSGIIVLCVGILCVGASVFQTTQHQTYFQNTLKTLEQITSTHIKITSFETSAFTSLAKTQVTIPTLNNATIALTHKMTSVPYKTVIESTFDLTDPQTRQLIQELEAPELKNFKFVTSVLPFTGNATITVHLKSLRSILEQQPETALNLQDLHLEVNAATTKLGTNIRIQTSCKNLQFVYASTRFEISNIATNSTTHFGNKLLNTSASNSVIGKIVVKVPRSSTKQVQEVLAIEDLQMQQKCQVTDTLNLIAKYTVKSMRINNAVVRNLRFNTEVSNILSAPIEELLQHFKQLQEHSASIQHAKASRVIVSELIQKAFSAQPKIYIHKISGNVEGSAFEITGAVKVNSAQQLMSGTPKALNAFTGSAELIADTTLYTSFGSLAEKIEALADNSEPTAAGALAKEASLRQFTNSLQVFKQKNNRLFSTVTLKNGKFKINERQLNW